MDRDSRKFTNEASLPKKKKESCTKTPFITIPLISIFKDKMMLTFDLQYVVIKSFFLKRFLKPLLDALALPNAVHA
tara:strand:+ start:2463 stop:2690 length:228 start_codon:yes stop_codon:yes gene_type:complete